MTQRQRRHFQYFISSGCILLALALGNIIYGHFKYNEYNIEYKNFSNGLHELNAQKSKLNNTQLDDFENESKKIIDNIRRSQQRMDFYKFFVNGGKVFLFLSLLLFSIAFTLYKKHERSVE